MKIQVSDFELKNIDYRNLKPLQGDLKDLSKKNYAKLKKSFESKGMFVPIFVWEREPGDFAILDGHGRERLFSTEKPTFARADGSETHDVPCLIIQAKDLKDAKEKLLIISSQYQGINKEGFADFSFDLDDEFLKEAIAFDLMFDMPKFENDEKKIESKKEIFDQTKFLVLVECRDEQEQRKIFDEFQDKGLECKLIM